MKGHIQAGGEGRSISRPGPDRKCRLPVSSQGLTATGQRTVTVLHRTTWDPWWGSEGKKKLVVYYDTPTFLEMTFLRQCFAQLMHKLTKMYTMKSIERHTCRKFISIHNLGMARLHLPDYRYTDNSHCQPLRQLLSFYLFQKIN